MSVKTCSDCGVGMEIGFVPDRTHGGWAYSRWYSGVPAQETFLGIPLGGIRWPSEKGLPLVSYRCPKCGLLKFYAEKGE